MARAYTAALSFACVLWPFLALAHDPAGHARHHEGFYMGLKQPGTGVSCCNNQDCRPAKFKITATGIQMEVAGKWIVPPMSKVIETETPGGNSAHWCGVMEHSASPITFCAIVPRGGV